MSSKNLDTEQPLVVSQGKNLIIGKLWQGCVRTHLKIIFVSIGLLFIFYLAIPSSSSYYVSLLYLDKIANTILVDLNLFPPHRFLYFLIERLKFLLFFLYLINILLRLLILVKLLNCIIYFILNINFSRCHLF